MSRTGITVIRPLVYLPESHVRHMTKALSLPLVQSPCPANGETRRAEMKELLRKLRLIYPDANERFLHALQQDRYDLWQKEDHENPPAAGL
jgi:tRNA(Ile)-lysidine synthase TilS/MesJ